MERKIRLSNGVTINVKYSEVKRPVVLFIHFSGGTLGMWNGVLPLFEEEYQVIAPDIRGHGKSDKPESGYHIDDMAGDLYLLLKELGISECHIVGSSMGAEVAVSLAAAHPDMVLSIVCEGALFNEFGEYGVFNGSPDEMEQEKARQREELAKRETLLVNSRSEYMEDVKVSLGDLWNGSFEKYFGTTLEEVEDGRFTSHYRNYVRTQYMENYWELRFEDYYKRVKCPILFMPSEEDSKDERIQRSLAAFADLVDTCEIKYIKDSLHAFVWMQFPLEAGTIAKEFVDRIDS